MVYAEINKLVMFIAKDICRRNNYKNNLSVNGIALYLLIVVLSLGVNPEFDEDMRKILHADYRHLYYLENLYNSSAASLFLSLKKLFFTEYYGAYLIFHDMPVTDYFRDLSSVLLDVNYIPVDLIHNQPLHKYFDHVFQSYNLGVGPSIYGQYSFGYRTLEIVSSFYFNRIWKYPFNPKNTFKAPFHVSKKIVAIVDMMKLTANLSYIRAEFFGSMVFLPYENSEVVAAILVPNRRTPISRLLFEIQADKIVEMYEMSKNLDIEVILPRFRIFTKIDAHKSLSALGLNNLFTSKGRHVHRISPSALHVNSLIQVSYIVVDEFGTHFNYYNVPSKITGLKKNRKRHSILVEVPFIFAILDPSKKLLLSLTVVYDPTNPVTI